MNPDPDLDLAVFLAKCAREWRALKQRQEMATRSALPWREKLKRRSTNGEGH